MVRRSNGAIDNTHRARKNNRQARAGRAGRAGSGFYLLEQQQAQEACRGRGGAHLNILQVEEEVAGVVVEPYVVVEQLDRHLWKESNQTTGIR